MLRFSFLLVSCLYIFEINPTSIAHAQSTKIASKSLISETSGTLHKDFVTDNNNAENDAAPLKQTIILNKKNTHQPSMDIIDERNKTPNLKKNNKRNKSNKSTKILAPEPVCFKAGHRSGQFYADGALRGPHFTPMEYLISKHQLLKKKGEVFSLEEQACLTTAIYHEARGEDLKGQIAVAQVIINRLINADFPNTICGVVYQRTRRICQFSFACDPKNQNLQKSDVNPESWDQASMIVANFIRGNIWLKDIANATYFHTTSVNPVWNKDFCKLEQVGSHIFYKIPDAFKLRYSLDNPTQRKISK